VVLSQVFVYHENLGYDQYGMLHLAEVDGGGNVESEVVEGDGEAGGEGFYEVSARTARDGVEAEGLGRVMEEVCREQIITEIFFGGGYADEIFRLIIVIEDEMFILIINP